MMIIGCDFHPSWQQVCRSLTGGLWGRSSINRGLGPVTCAPIFGSIGFVQISQHRVTNQKYSDGGDTHEDLRTCAQRAKARTPPLLSPLGP
jgi:hypothetical protein